MGGFGYPFPAVPDDGKNRSPFRSAEDVLTSPNDLDLGMLEALGVTPNATNNPTFQGASWGRPATGPSVARVTHARNQGPPAPSFWDEVTDPEHWKALLPGGKEWDAGIAGYKEGLRAIGSPLLDAGSAVYNWAGDRVAGLDEQVSKWDDQMDSAIGSVASGIGGAVKGAWDAAGNFFEEPSVWTGERPTLLPGRGVGPAQAQLRALGGSASEAERYVSDLQAQGDDAGALLFAEMYAEDTGVNLMDVTFDPSAPTYDDAGEMTPAASYAEMSPTDRSEFETWYNSPAVQEHYSTRTGFGEADPMIFKDFRAVQHFVSTLPSAAEVEEQAKKDVTQAEVDAYLKELDAMSDEDYNQIAKNLGLSPATYKTDGTTADKKFLEEGNIRAHESGSGFGLDPSADPFSTFSIDNDAILKQVAKAKSDCATQGGVWGATGCDLSGAGTSGDGGDGGDGADGAEGDDGIGTQIEDIFSGLVTQPQHDAIRNRMAELGTTDLTQAIRNEFATITTPDYSADILQRYDEMGTALSDAAAERTRVLEESTTRAEGRIGDIKTGLKSELEEFEVGRKAQQTTIEQGVIDRTTKMETDLTERLDDIRIALGDQVTSEFEEVAALAGTLTSSQATSSRDAISRLTQIGNMAAAARLSAPAEMSAEALTALSDLEFKVTNEISQGLADSQAQVKMQQASALLQETMRRGEFETEKQRSLVESVLQETLRGTVYEDRTKEMLAQALMQEDQYVRQFNEGVDQQLAGAQLQNLFGTQDYERKLDMMNLTRSWQTADTLQGRGWQTDDMNTTRGWQESDYQKALDDQRADALTARGWQQDDIAAELERQRAADLAAQPDMTKVLNRLRATFPDVSDSMYSIAMHVKDMDHNPPMSEPHQEDVDWEAPDGWRGETRQIKVVENGVVVPKLQVVDQVGDSQAEVYLKSLTDGAILYVDSVGSTQRTPALSAKDAGVLRAMVDAALGMDASSDMHENFENMSEDDFLRWALDNPTGPLHAASYGDTSASPDATTSTVNQYRPPTPTTTQAATPDGLSASLFGPGPLWGPQGAPDWLKVPAGGDLSPQGISAWLAAKLAELIDR